MNRVETFAAIGKRLANSRYTILVVIAAAAVLYTWRLGEAPAAVSNDEAHFAFHGYALATTGRDLNGVRLPLFVEMIDPLLPDVPGTAYWQPFLFYLTAASLKVFPFDEWSIRVPVVLVALSSVALLYAVVFETYRTRWLATVAALLLAMTPSWFVMGRQGIDYICPAPFVLAWLWCLTRFLHTRQILVLACAGVLLAATALTHISGWALVPVLTAVTLGTLAYRRLLQPRAAVAFACGLAVPAMAVFLWLLFHPGVMRELVARYGLVEDARWSSEAARSALSPTQRLSLYWDYFNPSFLFFAGGSHPTQTTSTAGVFLLPFAVLLPAGLRACYVRPRPVMPAVICGFVTAPLAVVLVLGALSDYSIGRVITLVPFGVLIAAHGIYWLCENRRRGTITLSLLAIVLPLQFASFLHDYFGEYQVRAAARFDALNTKAVADFVMTRAEQASVPLVYLSDDDRDSKAVRWRFHLWKAGREELWAKTRYFGVAPATDDVPAGSLLVFFHQDARAASLLDTGRYSAVGEFSHPSGDPASIVLLRH
ncbi:MAG TPA: glycosyltransferase family 39 protein [Vicinamibacterales bacterium]|nr:glycosyltransferase family 39 protein [Vicinamibacterales bacterium]